MFVKVLLTGGGSGGPVSPVLAVAEEIRKLRPKTEFLFVGTRKGPERGMVEAENIRFVSTPSAKLRRYFSLKNFFDVFTFIFALVRAVWLVGRFRPDIIFSAGGYVGVPICWIGKLFGSKLVIHQQDVRIGLANRLVAPFAQKITTAFEFTAKNFYSGSGLFTRRWQPPAEWVGNPFRNRLTGTASPAQRIFGLAANRPLLVVLGGATGSVRINEILCQALPSLLKTYQIIHQTGRNKQKCGIDDPNYHSFDILPFEKYAAALQAADLIVARAGLSTMAELSALGKPAIIIPMSGSHQEDNGAILQFTSSAVVLDERRLTPEIFITAVNKLNFDPDGQKILKSNIMKLFPKDAALKLAQIIIKVHGK